MLDALEVCFGMRFMQKFPRGCRQELLESCEYESLQEGENYYADSECYWVLLRGTMQHRIQKTYTTLREDILVEDPHTALKALEECHLLKFDRSLTQSLVSSAIGRDTNLLSVWQFLRDLALFRKFSEFHLQLLAASI